MAHTPKTAAEWRRRASETSDLTLAQGYLAKAAAVETAAAALKPSQPEHKPTRKYTSADLLKAIVAASPAQRAEFRRLLGDIVAPASSTKAAAPDLTKLATLKTDITDAVKAAFAETTKGFEVEIARIRKMADTGGPIRPRREPGSEGRSADYYCQLAADVADPVMAARYRALAAEADARSNRH